jgi:hypothetical protein
VRARVVPTNICNGLLRLLIRAWATVTCATSSGEVASTAKLWSKDRQVRAGWINSLLRQGISRRFGLVIGPDPHRYGLARMLSIYLEEQGVDLRIFHDREAALGWLTARA